MADNVNISPEIINNLMNMLKNTETSNPNTSEVSKVSENQENNIDINKLQSIISNFTSNTNTNANENTNNNSLDFETIMKIKNMMENLNSKNDPRSNLLYSLKPYLRKSKQNKLEQYANLLKITQVTGLFKNEKGESK